MSRKTELMVPIEEPALKRRLVRVLESFFNDNTQAYRLLPNGASQRLTRAKGQKAFRVQDSFYQLARKAACQQRGGCTFTSSDVGVLDTRRRRVAVGFEQAGESLRVVLVHLAPEGAHEVPLGHTDSVRPVALEARTPTLRV